MSLTELPQTIVNGLLLGCLYAGFALGLSLILGVLRIVNVAHSAVLIAGALVYWQLVNVAGLDPLLAILPVLALFYLIGLGLHRGIAQRLSREQDSTVLLATFGLLVVIESIAILVWATDTRNVELGYLGTVLRFWGLNIRLSVLVAAALTLVLLLSMHAFLTRSLYGSAIRGIAENSDVAGMVGINVSRLARHVFAVGIALAAFGGTVLGMAVPFSPQEHVRWLAWAFLVVIIGGLGSMRNTLLAGLAVGLIEAIVGLVLPFQYTYLVLYGLLAAALLIRKEGLGGVTARTI
jgi:branched-chain amino acid transport system permease protein